MVTGRSSGWAGTRHSTMRGFAPHTPHTLSRAPLRRRAPFAWLTHCVRSHRDLMTHGQWEVRMQAGPSGPGHVRPRKPSPRLCAEPAIGIRKQAAGSRQLATGNFQRPRDTTLLTDTHDQRRGPDRTGEGRLERGLRDALRPLLRTGLALRPAA